ncbi:hypothetical protein SAMN05216188_104280 [Lentzea xinjiangensis]|uniref:Uncharacterized protein n=1 Tax=Lentzea xinjiangensis TaxID=402600 RepID=A0A1H9HZN9_9PSEU|nr:hypothetical protein [Lentzea xinjiangensis]SEQ67869.1 hypothetical protein SAMN05216188_104280 [Lentzea xinjiangensis]
MTQDNTGKLAEELRLLVETAAERVQPWLHRVAEAGDGSHAPETCGWCPLCNGAALLRGDRSELAAKAAEHAAGLIAVLRAALREPGGGPSPAPPGADAPADTGQRVQHIKVVRKSD